MPSESRAPALPQLLLVLAIAMLLLPAFSPTIEWLAQQLARLLERAAPESWELLVRMLPRGGIPMNGFWQALLIAAEVLIIVGFWASKQSRPTRSAHPGAVENLLGLTPAPGNRFVGNLGGVRIETWWAFEDDFSKVRTSAKACFAVPLDLGVSIVSPVPPYHPLQTRPWLAGPGLPTRGTISIDADDGMRVAQLLGNGETERLLTALAGYAQVVVDDSGVSLHMRQSVDGFWRQWALEQVVNAVRALEEGRRRVGVAVELQSFEAGCIEIAQQYGVKTMRAPLGIWGTVYGMPLVAHSLRQKRRTFGFVIAAQLPWNLPLIARPRGDLVRRTLALLLEGKPIHVPHATFRERFEVRAVDPDRARADLSDDLCGLLVELSNWGRVEVEQATLRIELPRPPAARELGMLLDLLAPLGAVLSGAATSRG